MKCVDALQAGELKGKRVFLRSDFNLPLTETGEVADLFRLKQGWNTVQYLSSRGARVVVASHIGRAGDSIEPVARAMEQFGKVFFVPDIAGPIAQDAVKAMKDGEVVLLENLRRDPREVGNDEGFARELAALGDMYVDDAFAAAHRAHASIVGVPKFLPGYAGLLMRDEVRAIDAARAPQSPSFAILGGAKFETKAPLIKSLLAAYDHLFITGALANDVFKARGLEVGRSLISAELPQKDVLDHPHFVAPVDVTVERSDKQASVKKPDAVASDEIIYDIGPDTIAAITPMIESAKFILWNGPTGYYEGGYIHYTQAIAELISRSQAKIVIGGGDTIAAIEQAGVKMGENAFLSTGGGAMLEYLLKGTLPGIAALG